MIWSVSTASIRRRQASSNSIRGLIQPVSLTWMSGYQSSQQLPLNWLHQRGRLLLVAVVPVSKTLAARSIRSPMLISASQIPVRMENACVQMKSAIRCVCPPEPSFVRKWTHFMCCLESGPQYEPAPGLFCWLSPDRLSFSLPLLYCLCCFCCQSERSMQNC